MRILAIIGSPRKKGNTYNMVRRLEDDLRARGELEFEYVFLKDENLELCQGCGA